MLLGVTRGLLFSLISSSTKCTKAQLLQMCNNLEKVLTPHCFKRGSRSLAELSNWKAHELKHFLLYHGPMILQITVDDTFVTHFLVLSVAVRLLLVDVTECRIAAAEALLLEFVKTTPQLYGELSQTHNCHLLLHLPSQVTLNFASFKHKYSQ